MSLNKKRADRAFFKQDLDGVRKAVWQRSRFPENAEARIPVAVQSARELLAGHKFSTSGGVIDTHRVGRDATIQEMIRSLPNADALVARMLQDLAEKFVDEWSAEVLRFQIPSLATLNRRDPDSVWGSEQRPAISEAEYRWLTYKGDPEDWLTLKQTKPPPIAHKAVFEFLEDWWGGLDVVYRRQPLRWFPKFGKNGRVRDASEPENTEAWWLTQIGLMLDRNSTTAEWNSVSEYVRKGRQKRQDV